MYPRFFTDTLLEHFESVLNEETVEMMRLAYFSPFFSSSTYRGIPDPKWMGNPFLSSNFIIYPGLPSGLAMNTENGKFGGTGTVLCILDKIFGDTLSRMDDVLKGEHPLYGILNQGDDTIVMFAREEDMLKYKRLIGDRKNPSYFYLQEEKAFSFLGNLGASDEKGNFRLIPNVQSFIVNWMCPERSASSEVRKYFYIGWDERRKLYSAAGRAYQSVESAMEKHFYDVFKFDIHAYARFMKGIPIASGSEIDNLVMQNPDLLHYRFTPEDISPELADQLVSVVPEDLAEHVWNSTFSVTLN